MTAKAATLVDGTGPSPSAISIGRITSPYPPHSNTAESYVVIPPITPEKGGSKEIRPPTDYQIEVVESKLPGSEATKRKRDQGTDAHGTPRRTQDKPPPTRRAARYYKHLGPLTETSAEPERSSHVLFSRLSGFLNFGSALEALSHHV
jgi:hypothetical protein